ncbi:MAG: hypothetical protein HYU51_07415 [Candidatus Rokubacteria bacterium]|nr:hypothetical protein [Candidatus Rokubacteria bacterium]
MSTDPDLGGPYLQIAAFCENVIEGKDGVLSLIRVIDRFVHTAVGAGAPEKMPAVPVNAHLVLSFKSGFAKGSFPVKIRGVSPDGKPLPDVSIPMQLEGDDRGQNIVLQVGLVLEQEGLYWFDVYVGERLMTRMPLRLVYQRLVLGP